MADAAILDAARATVLDFGVRRATVTEIARRSGLSRMTVYRRFADAPELMRALMTREFGAVLEQARAESAELASGRQRLVASGARTVELLVTNPLMLRLLELEPEAVLPYMTERLGKFQTLVRKALRAAVAEGQADGSIRDGDPKQLAAALETFARGLVLGARMQTARERVAALREFELMLDAYLAPPLIPRAARPAAPAARPAGARPRSRRSGAAGSSA